MLGHACMSVVVIVVVVRVTRDRMEWPNPGSDCRRSCQINKARPANVHAPSSLIENMRTTPGCSWKACRNCMRSRTRMEGGGCLGWRTSSGKSKPADMVREGHCRDKAGDDIILSIYSIRILSTSSRDSHQ